MKIYIVAVGRLRERYHIEAERRFLARIRNKADIRIMEITSPGKGSAEQEGEEMLSRIPNGFKTIMLDVGGKSTDTMELAGEMAAGEVAFLIGGPDGYGENVYEKIPRRMSLSAMTYTHQTARLLLLEQIEMILNPG